MSNRRARPTIRCLSEDLGIEVPGIDVDLGGLDHPLLVEARRVSPTAPLGQKRVLDIDRPLVYRIRHGPWRGATWLDEANEILWLLSVERREEDSPDDAYEHFVGLHARGKLLPTDEDRVRDRAETVGRFVDRIEKEIPSSLSDARNLAAQEHSSVIGDLAEVRLYVARSEDMEEIWVAVPLFDVTGSTLPSSVRDVIFAGLRESGR